MSSAFTDFIKLFKIFIKLIRNYRKRQNFSLNEFCILSETEKHKMDTSLPYSREYGNFDWSNYKAECGQEYNYQVSIGWLEGTHCPNCGKIILLSKQHES